VLGSIGFWCKEIKKFENNFSNLAILVLLLKKVRDQYGKRKYIQMETLSTRPYFINCALVPTVQPKLS
ncbi:hypothetical protein WAG19_30310, partial [Bacillus cereus]